MKIEERLAAGVTAVDTWRSIAPDLVGLAKACRLHRQLAGTLCGDLADLIDALTDLGGEMAGPDPDDPSAARPTVGLPDGRESGRLSGLRCRKQGIHPTN